VVIIAIEENDVRVVLAEERDERIVWLAFGDDTKAIMTLQDAPQPGPY
jgi:hypothetical protein